MILSLWTWDRPAYKTEMYDWITIFMCPTFRKMLSIICRLAVLSTFIPSWGTWENVELRIWKVFTFLTSTCKKSFYPFVSFLWTHVLLLILAPNSVWCCKCKKIQENILLYNITWTVSVTSRLAKVLETTFVKIILSRCLFSNLGSNLTDSILTLWLFFTSRTCTPGFMDSRSTASTRSGQEWTWILDICK